jgi:predicted transcriptional regulator of viral defense system
MKNLLLHKLASQPTLYLTDTEINLLIDGNSNSRYGKLKRWLQNGDLIHLRRGLYCLGERLAGNRKPHPFVAAQRIYSPSYISLESAMAYHQLIPEAVYTITSVTTKRKNEFNNSLGNFNYEHLPVKNFYLEVELINENNEQLFMAKPWKAIGDYIYCYKKEWRNLEPLLKSLRVERENLPSLRHEEIEELIDYYQHRRLTRFFNDIKKELSL